MCILLQHLYIIVACVHYLYITAAFVYYCNIRTLLQHLYIIAAYNDWFCCLDRSSMHFSFPISCANCALIGPISDGLVQQAVNGLVQQAINVLVQQAINGFGAVDKKWVGGIDD